MLLPSDAAALTAIATAAATATAPAMAPADRPPKPPVLACEPPVAAPGSGPNDACMDCTCGGAGGDGDGGVGGAPWETVLVKPEFTVVVAPDAVTVAAPSTTVTDVNPLAATVTTRVVPLMPIKAVGVRME